jgi:transcription elongation factor GreB
MSKAFTRESDDSDREEVSGFRPAAPPGTRNLITPEGAARLKHRLDALVEQKQDSHLADAERRKLEGEIRKLQATLGSIVITGPPHDREKVAFGATVVVRHENGEEEVFRIVGVEEADPAGGAISWASPLARALLSRMAGERVRFRSPGGERELTIVSVDWPCAGG